jgi:hypothetical protein
MIDRAGIKARFETLAPHLDEQTRRLFAATEVNAAGRGGVKAVSEATGVARSTIGRGLAELRSTASLNHRIRRPGAAADQGLRLNPAFSPRWKSSYNRRPAAIPRRYCFG